MGLGPDLGLGERADREHGARELILREREQEVRLVLVGIETAPEQQSSVSGLLDASVMSRGQVLRPETARAVQKRRELHVAVAMRAGNRRAAGRCTR